MATKKKPAITGLHSQGIVDDIIRPIIRSAAQNIADKGVGRIASKADSVARNSSIKRAKSYAKRGKDLKYALVDADVKVKGSKSPAKNYKAGQKTRAYIINQNNINKLKKK